MSATSTPTDERTVAAPASETKAPDSAPKAAEPTKGAEFGEGVPKQEQPQPTVADKVLGALKPDGEKQPEQPKKDGEQKPAPTAPDKYEPWKLQDGVKLSKDLDSAFSELAKRAGLSQDDAQATLDKMVTANLEQQRQEFAAQVEQWGEALNADPELGGDALLAKTMPNVNKALTAFDPSGKVAAILQNGLGANPDLVRFLAKVGEAVSPTSALVTGQRTAPAKPSIDDLYENTKPKVK